MALLAVLAQAMSRARSLPRIGGASLSALPRSVRCGSSGAAFLALRVIGDEPRTNFLRYRRPASDIPPARELAGTLQLGRPLAVPQAHACRHLAAVIADRTLRGCPQRLFIEPSPLSYAASRRSRLSRFVCAAHSGLIWPIGTRRRAARTLSAGAREERPHQWQAAGLSAIIYQAAKTVHLMSTACRRSPAGRAA
ncbi:hypothetical protein PsYK624_033170 [Phanerochaete sordida]|uniref:Uncharacterized protein n=1 Tax=Phanerochaete sordida TaxID=48140 RepID=A0A9P3LA68_9APHY|nr:hypothetical protein PsYK624_033170 [Phanerochaete sordida]